jgi:MinD-like ATPase involved in chromosome partitioning or flagellar assembly
MSRIVTLYSYRGGTGKSTTAVNLAWLLAERGERVAVIDNDLRSPAVHTLLGITPAGDWISFTDYLVGRCSLLDATQRIDLTANLAANLTTAEPGGALYAVPACNRAVKMAEIATRGYDVGLLHEAYDQLVADLELDTLVLDTPPGTANETAVALERCDTVLVTTRAERLDLIDAPKAMNQISGLSDARRVLAVYGADPRAESTAGNVEALELGYGAEAIMVPTAASDRVATSAFVATHPEHPLTEAYRALADSIAGVRR